MMDDTLTTADLRRFSTRLRARLAAQEMDTDWPDALERPHHAALAQAQAADPLGLDALRDAIAQRLAADGLPPEPAPDAQLEPARDALIAAGAAVVEQIACYAQLVGLLGARGQTGAADWHAASERLRDLLDAELEAE